MSHKAEWWSERMLEVEATGDAAGVARRHGVRLKTLRWWRSELRRRAKTLPRPRLLPVVVKNSPPDVGALEVFVEFGELRMTLRGSVSSEQLTALVSASRAC